ncbi:PAS domain S-box protein, partial [Neptuniibacter marinus]
PLNITTTRLLTKYPLAVSIVTDFKGSFAVWIEQKRIFLLILGAAIATLIIGTVYIVRINNSALEMKEEVHLLSEVVENNPTVIIITNREGQIQYVNNSFEAISGYKKDEVLGQTSRMFK